MKIISIILMFILMTTDLLAFEVAANWSDRFERMINVSCQADEEYLCADLCGEYQQCQVKEKICGNCTGDNMFLRYFFKEIGQSIVNQQKEMSKEELISILKQGNFVSLDAKSIYNFVDKFNSLQLRERFRSLCPNISEAPMVFLEVHAYTREPEKILAVACTDLTRDTSLFYLHKVYQLESN